MAKRSLSFLHNCIHEMRILELSVNQHPAGSIACWTFLSCLEILLTCEQHSDASNRIQLYCLYTASLWTYAREKLEELGAWGSLIWGLQVRCPAKMCQDLIPPLHCIHVCSTNNT